MYKFVYLGYDINIMYYFILSLEGRSYKLIKIKICYNIKIIFRIILYIRVWLDVYILFIWIKVKGF